MKPRGGVVRNEWEPRQFWMKGAVTMTVTKQSPMNPEHLNDVDTGIDALSRNGLVAPLEGLSLPGL
jgi:hypothetical protein